MVNATEPRDILWHLSDAITPEELDALRRAVAVRRGRELNWRALFIDGSPDELAREGALGAGDRLFVAGGDGSLHLAARALLTAGFGGNGRPEVAVLPRGTGNDFARALNVPLGDWELAVKCAVGDRVVRSDLGRLNGDYFVNAVTMGFGAEATRDIPARFKQLVGGAGYAAFTAWKALLADPVELEVKCPNGEGWKGEALALIVLNGNTIGGGARLGADARIDDGLLDLVVVPALGAADLPDLVGDLREGDPALFQHLRYIQSNRFEIASSRELALSIDGEPSAGDRFTLEVEPDGLQFVAGEMPVKTD